MVHVYQVSKVNISDIQEVCIAGWRSDQPTAAGWVYWKQDSIQDTLGHSEVEPYLIQGIVMCICLFFSVSLLWNYLNYLRGNN